MTKLSLFCLDSINSLIFSKVRDTKADDKFIPEYLYKTAAIFILKNVWKQARDFSELLW